MHVCVVLRSTRCLTAVLQGNTATRRAGLSGRRSIAQRQTQWLARRSLSATSIAGMAQRVVPLGHNGNVQTVTSEFLSADDLSPGTHLHLILLNYILPPQTVHLWQRATTRICADGGANRLYDQIPSMLPGVDPYLARQSHLPDLIKGDLDSVRPDVQDFYTSRGIPFIDLSSDQETTDLEKCLLFLEGRLRSMSEAAAKRPVAANAMVASAAGAAPAHGAKAIGLANAARTLGDVGPSSSSSSNGSSGIALNVDCSIASTSMAPRTPSGPAETSNSSQPLQQQPQIVGEVVMLPVQQEEQQHWLGAGQELLGHSSLASKGHSSSSSHVHDVRAGILASHDLAGEAAPASKRVQQEHLILVLGALGGRLDHTLANLNTLYCYPHLNITLWGDGNLVRLLRAGRSAIKPSRLEGPTCGLVPLARPATASSKGLKWDLENTHMCFRGLLSTSNVILSDTIEVATDEDLLWITAVGDTVLAKMDRSKH